ncbi:MAG: PD40 domain-containing protein, partial [Acidobacteria bacterium]|nr:PD40 domain-containing protein [Acidobacteriota bacterium]
MEGEEQLLLYTADNSAPPKELGTQEPGWHAWTAWSPDGRRLAWGDHKLRLIVADAASGATSVVDTGEFEIRTYEWSPDSRYLAYDVSTGNGFNQVRLWDGQTKTVHDFSDPMFNSHSPTWDPKGKYLYYLSDRWINPHLDRFESRFIVQKAALPVVVALQADGRLPFAPRGGVDPKTDDAKNEEKKEGGKKDGDAKKQEEKVEPIRIDFDGIMERVVQVPVPPGDFFGLKAVETRTSAVPLATL